LTLVNVSLPLPLLVFFIHWQLNLLYFLDKEEDDDVVIMEEHTPAPKNVGQEDKEDGVNASHESPISSPEEPAENGEDDFDDDEKAMMEAARKIMMYNGSDQRLLDLAAEVYK
jgi:hypothetical protein